MGEFHQTFEEEIIHNTLILREEGLLPNSFYKISITMKPKPGKDITWDENYKLIFFMNTDVKNSKHSFSKVNPTIYTKDNASWDLSQECTQSV